MSVNRIILLGNVDSPVHIHTPPTGSKIANFILVTSEEWRDKSGADRQRQERHKIAIFGDRLVDEIDGKLPVGTHLYLEGQLEARRWRDPQNVEMNSVDVVIRSGRGRMEIFP